MRKRIICLATIALTILCACGEGYDSDTPCVYCDRILTKRFEAASGECYVCESCSTECMFCDKEAAKQYFNGLGYPTFVCGECYKEVQELNE